MLTGILCGRRGLLGKSQLVRGGMGGVPSRLRLVSLAIKGELLLRLNFGDELGFISVVRGRECLGKTADDLTVGVSPTVSAMSAVEKLMGLRTLKLFGIGLGLGVLSRSTDIIFPDRTLGEGSLRGLVSDFLSLLGEAGLLARAVGKTDRLCVRGCDLEAVVDLVAANIRSVRVRSFISTIFL